MLEVLLATEDAGSPIFQMYWERIGRGLRIPDATETSAFEQLSSGLPTVVRKGSLPRCGRWFSWNATAHEQLLEFNILMMLLEHHFATSEDDLEDTNAAPGDVVAVACEDPWAELRALKTATGGFRLAYKLMSDGELPHNAEIMFVVTNGLWDWYSDQVGNWP